MNWVSGTLIVVGFVALGCSNEIGEAILGHLPANIVATYNKYQYDNERQEWLMRLNEKLEELSR